MIIDCNSCQAKPSACADCVISVLLEADPMGTELEPAEASAFAALADEGLVPPLRLVPVYPIEGGDAGWRAS